MSAGLCSASPDISSKVDWLAQQKLFYANAAQQAKDRGESKATVDLLLNVVAIFNYWSEKVLSLGHDFADLKADNLRLQSVVDQNKVDKEKTEAVCADLCQQLAYAQTTNYEMSHKLDALSDEDGGSGISALRWKLDQAHRNNTDLRKELDKARQENNAYRDLDYVDNELIQVRAVVADLRKQQNVKDEAIKNLASKNADFQAQIDFDQQVDEEMHRELTNAHARTAKLRDKLNKSQDKIAYAQQIITELLDVISDQEKTIDELNLEVDAGSANNEELQDRLAKVKKENDDLRTQYAHAHAELSNVIGDNRQKQEETKTLRDQLDASLSSNNCLRAPVYRLESETTKCRE